MERDEFLKTYKKYQLGHLPTEQQHPLTINLSQQVQSDLHSAYTTLQQVDLKALSQLQQYSENIEALRSACQQTLAEGGRVFICGCGATGRLALTIESLWREKYNSDQVVAFMAGGDIALVHSLEGFEDYPEYGERHLSQLGFSSRDLLVAVTEGGETPYVLGALEAAVTASERTPWLLYCNPDEALVNTVERSKRAIENPAISKLCLFVGPMALSGSTRMQASTVLQLAVGLALVDTDSPVDQQLTDLVSWLSLSVDYASLTKLTRREAQIYKQQEYVMYVPKQMAITVFTDTTERSPTFNLPAFNPGIAEARPSLCFIMLPSAQTSEEAWPMLLGREPKSLGWGDVSQQTEEAYLHQFDFSKHSLEKRANILGQAKQYLFEIDLRRQNLQMSLDGIELEVPLGGESSLMQQTCLKMLINAHSTAVMGLLGRYQSNMMTWVTATNGKLIDRACRYVTALLAEDNICYDYLEIAQAIFDIRPTLGKNECLVLKTVDHLKEPRFS